jgi:peroxiredoxin
MQRVARVGQVAPAFSLPNVTGAPVSLDELRARGPLVLSFYRGRW